MSEPLNICIVSQEFPPHTNWGGVGVQFDIFARALVSLGHTVSVVSRTSAGAPPHEVLPTGVEVWRIDASVDRKRRTGRTVDRILFARNAAAVVTRLDRVRRFDVVEAALASLEADALVSDPEFIERLVISSHGSNRQLRASGWAAPLHRLDWWWAHRRERRLLERVRAVLVSSAATRQVVLQDGAAQDAVHMVPLGIDTELFHPNTAARSAGPLDVGFVGRLQAAKGIDFVWRVLEQLGPDSGIRFHFKGALHATDQAETRERLQRYASFARYSPPSPNDAMPAFYRGLDVLLLPSRFENFGLTYAEAMASGVVVFAGTGGGGPELISDGDTGFLVDPDGPIDDVVNRLRMMAADRASFADLATRARAEIVKRYSAEQFALQKLAVYRQLIGTKPLTPLQGAT